MVVFFFLFRNSWKFVLIVLFELFNIATFWSSLCRLNALFFCCFFQHVYQHFVLHFLDVLAPRVNVVKHPVKQVLVAIFIYRLNGFSNLLQLKNACVFVIFTLERVCQRFFVATKLFNRLFLHYLLLRVVNPRLSICVDFIRAH